jgi:predicted HD superfamily hydrolase involved in NAD metabolism
MTKAEIIEWIKEKTNPGLYSHSTATQELAAELAEIYNVDRERAMLAGLLHDCAKRMSHAELLLHAERYHIQLDPVRMAQPGLLHAPVGSELVRAELAITDDEVLNALAVHNTGSRDMSRLGEVLYLADAAERTRSYPGVQQIRELALSGALDIALLATMDMKIRHVLEKRLMLHPMSVEARNEVLKRITSP